MAKNKKQWYDREPQQKKRSLTDIRNAADGNSSPKPESNLVRDELLNLYKREAAANLNKPIIQEFDKVSYGTDNIKDLNNSNNEFLKTPNTQSVKTPKTLKRTAKKAFSFKKSSVTFSDVGGLEKELKRIMRLFLHLKLPNVLKKLGVDPVRGFLLHGPSGCGKTLFAHAVAGEFELPLVEVAATELVCGISGESESKIRDLFDDAVKNSPCVLFIDEIDAISAKRDTSDRGMERRMVTQLLKCFDELNAKDSKTQVMVIGATTRIDSIDTALRRGGRFDHEIAIGMPDEDTRLKILKILCKDLNLSSNADLSRLARITPGYVGADLKTIVIDAAEFALCRVLRDLIKSNQPQKSQEGIQNENVENLFDSEEYLDSLSLEEVRSWYKSDSKHVDENYEPSFEFRDFEIAVKNCVPFSKREGFATVTDVTWDDVGALKDVRKVLQAAVLWPVKHKRLFESCHIASTKGILLCGPKGCGKTLIAKAIANECSINFLSVKGPELLSMYLGESEKAVRQCFQRARNSAPCVIFFDEIDALCPSRSGSNVNAAAERVVNQLLTEMDGTEDRKQVFVIAATNRPEKIDSAMLRPGRLEKIIFVDLPAPADRVEILKSITKNKTRPNVAEDLDLETIGLDDRCNGFSGADLAYLVREASFNAMEEHLNQDESQKFEISLTHFEDAFTVVKPSVSIKDRQYYKENYLKIFSQA